MRFQITSLNNRKTGHEPILPCARIPRETRTTLVLQIIYEVAAGSQLFLVQSPALHEGAGHATPGHTDGDEKHGQQQGCLPKIVSPRAKVQQDQAVPRRSNGLFHLLRRRYRFRHPRRVLQLLALGGRRPIPPSRRSGGEVDHVVLGLRQLVEGVRLHEADLVPVCERWRGLIR